MTKKTFWDDNSNDKDDYSSKDNDAGDRKSMLIRRLLVSLGAVSLVGLGAAGVLYGVKQKPEWFGLGDSSVNEAKVQEEAKRLAEEVGRIIELPKDEIPKLATVGDLSAVSNQPFFAKAKVGDKVLVYVNAKKLYLYRPSDKKVIEVGVLNASPSELQGQVAGEDIEVVSSPASQDVPQPTLLPSPTTSFTPTPTANIAPTISEETSLQ